MNEHPSSIQTIDPVCGMVVDPAKAAASLETGNGTIYFCSTSCHDQFKKDPNRYGHGAPLDEHACCAHEHEPSHGKDRASRLAMPAASGLAAGGALLLLYFGILTLVSGWAFTLEQFETYWPYIVALAAGFGIQAGLFLYLRQAIHTAAQAGKVVAVTGTTSGVAMVSCCTHYLVNVLPVLGTTGLASLVGQYQIELFWFGLAANVLGITFMSRRLMDFSRGKATAKATIAILLLAGFGFSAPINPAYAESSAMTAQVNNQGGVSVTATPVSVTGEGPWLFKIVLSTHSVTLDQDMTTSAVLVAEGEQEMRPIAWEGDPAGGHHREGTLSFAAPSPRPATITLKIRGVSVPERAFSWPHPNP